MRAEAIKQATDNCKVDLPELMIENRIDHMIEELDINLQNRGMALEQYLAFTKMDLEQVRNNYREAATINVKTDMMLEAIARKKKK